MGRQRYNAATLYSNNNHNITRQHLVQQDAYLAKTKEGVI